MAKVYLGLGSNIGDRVEQLRNAVRMIGDRDVTVDRVSSVYETEPVGGVPQDNFCNMVIGVTTDLSPRALLNRAKVVEERLKRVREVRWGPRAIDVDILLYEGVAVNEEDLVIPHPQMCNRAFVLIPLIEIAPDILLPCGSTVSEYLNKVSGQCVKKIGSLI